MAKPDFYDVLGLKRSATPQQIKLAYRKLAKKHHPDHAKGSDASQAAAKFNEIQEAYSVLSDPEKRKLYDRFGHSGVSGAGPSAQRVWRTGPPNADFRDFVDDSGGFQSIFAQFFGRSRRPQRRWSGPAAAPPAKGQDLTHKISISFIEAALGTTATVKLRATDQAGKAKTQTIEAKVPPGVDDGSKIRIRGKGHPSPTGGNPGDLYLQINVQPHPHLWREDRDVYVELPVTFTEAALGASLEVPTLQTPTTVTVPPGVSSGQKLRLRNKGIPPGKKSQQPGHQYVVIKIVSPKDLSTKAAKLLKDFQRAAPQQLDRFK